MLLTGMHHNQGLEYTKLTLAFVEMTRDASLILKSATEQHLNGWRQRRNVGNSLFLTSLDSSCVYVLVLSNSCVIMHHPDHGVSGFNAVFARKLDLTTRNACSHNGWYNSWVHITSS